MNPRTPVLLNRLLAFAEKSLDRPTGDERRIREIERIEIEIIALRTAPPAEQPRLVNEFTQMFACCLSLLEQEGPLGDGDRIVRAGTLGHVLIGFIKRDAARALELSRPATTDQDRGR